VRWTAASPTPEPTPTPEPSVFVPTYAVPDGAGYPLSDGSGLPTTIIGTPIGLDYGPWPGVVMVSAIVLIVFLLIGSILHLLAQSDGRRQAVTVALGMAVLGVVGTITGLTGMAITAANAPSPASASSSTTVVPEDFVAWVHDTYGFTPTDGQARALLDGRAIAADQFGIRTSVVALEGTGGALFLFDGSGSELRRVADLPAGALTPVIPPPPPGELK